MKVKLTAAAAIAAALAFSQTPAVVVSPTPMQQFFDASGARPLAGGCVATYAAGTTTPLATAKDAQGTPNLNPITLDSSGRASIWIGSAAIKYVVKLKSGSSCSLTAGTVLYSQDQVQDQSLKLRSDITGPNGLAMIPFTQPATPAAPTPNGATLASNLKMAQTVNAQDFELPDPTKSCSANTHDDAAAINAAVDYARRNGGGTVAFPRGNCWMNSRNFGTGSVNLAFASNLTIDLGGTVLDSAASGTVAFGTSTAGSATPGYMVSYNALFAAGHDQWTSPLNDLPAGANHVFITPAANAGHYHKGDAIFIQSGLKIMATPFNSEVLVAAVDGNATSGEVDFRDPTIHAYTNDGMYDWGLVNVEANTIHNLHIKNATSARGTSLYLAAIVQCVDCSIEGSNWDSVDNSYIVDGQTLNLNLINNNVRIRYTQPNGSGFFQVATGMTRTHFINNQMTCISSVTTPFITFTEGSGATDIIGGEMNGTPNCANGGSYFSGVKVQNVKIVGGGFNMGAGAGVGSGFIFDGNDVLDTDTGSQSPLLLGNTGAVVTGNKFSAPGLVAGTPVVTWVGNCGGCVFSGNAITGGGLVLQSNDNHAFSVTGNVITGKGSGNCIFVSDNGVQTLALTIANNYCSGFATDLTFPNFSHEHFPILAPNAFGDATPYSPAAAGVLNIVGYQAAGPGINRFAVTQQGGNTCAPDTPLGDAYGGSFVAHVSGDCSVNINPGGNITPIAAPHGWIGCTFQDVTTPANTPSWVVLGTNATTVGAHGATASGDTIVWACTRPY